MLQHAAKDMDCVGEDCTIFNPVLPDNKTDCKVAVGGWQNCCNNPPGVSEADYYTLLSLSMKIDAAAGNDDLLFGDYQGAWSTLKNLTPDFIRNPWASASDATTAGGQAMSDSAFSTWKAEMFQKGMGATRRFIGETMGMGDQVADMFVRQVGNEYVAGYAAQALVYLYYAYLLYVVLTLLWDLIWPCTDEELQLSNQRHLKSCHKLGSYCKDKVLGFCLEKRNTYCCYTTALARIMHQQIRPQTGQSWGSPKRPSCGGIKISDLDLVDWDQVDLDEWIAIQLHNGTWPDREDRFGIEEMTGTNSAFNLSGDERDDTQVRTEERISDTDLDAVRRELYDQIYQGAR